MPERNQDPEDEKLQDKPEEELSAGSPIDQNSIDAVVQSDQGSPSDELESLLEDLDNDESGDIDTSDADQLENLVENLENQEGEGNPDDILHQTTLQDVSETQEPVSEAQVPIVDELDPTASEATSGTDSTGDELDALVSALDDDNDQPEARVAEPLVESEDLDTLLSSIDDEETQDDQPEGVIQTEEEADTEASVTAELTETEEETELEGEELEDLGSLLEDLDQPSDDTSETESTEEKTEDLDSLTQEFEEPPSDSEIESKDAAEDLESVLDALDQPADTDDAEQEGELEDVESLLEDLNEPAANVAKEEEGLKDEESLLEDLDLAGEAGSPEGAPTEAEILEDDGVEDMAELLENLDESAEVAETETEAVEKSEELEDFDALLEDLDVVDEPSPVAEATIEEGEPVGEELDATEDLEANIEDLSSLLEDLEEPSEEEREAAEETSDLEVEEEVEVGSLRENTSAEDDLNSLFDNDDTSFEGELDADLNVGVEHEVAHMLATGQAAPTPEGEDLFEDFASGQTSLIDNAEEKSGGIVLIVDDDEDNIGLFQDALVEGDYDFMGANTSDEALDIARTQDLDLVLVNLNTANEEGVKVVAQLTADDTPRLPVVVTSEKSELIGDALLAGAVDHFVRPVGIVDLEYQIPRTVSNLIKLKRAQHVLAVTGSESADVQNVVSSSGNNLDDLLSDEDDDFLIDDDDNALSLSDLDIKDDILEGNDALTPADRLHPLTDQSKMIREKEWVQKRKPASHLPRILGIGTLMILLSGLTGLATMYFMDVKQQEIADKEVIQRPQPVPVLKPPKVQQAGYEISRNRFRPTDDYQRQAESVKARIRNTVRDLDSQNGSWWSPWRVMREAGGSVAVLVQGRNSDEIIEAFGVDRSAVREGLGSRRSLNYLRGVGYDLEGKDVDDLTSRETFELLSAREIKSQDQIVNVLSKLTDRLATDKTEQAKNRTTQQKRQGTANLTPSRPKPTEQISQTTVEHPDLLSGLKPNRLKLLGFAIRLPGVPHSSEAG